ncbi:MAG: HlyD family efflux transporter periplasmic adaptor subunit [Methylobacter sp.]|uniref:HlyD family efflux transporter periplasmic adaptor subunit n=1 Tax=Methylobacter sp. TaxID=2051955 RepID=UPI002730746F|nr:HlyD family efflux transporter periplasmic adaptor subunit [Methylobacter sp.]MDP1666336.1 HlyD family efflux transporter periplasmic adaptor subunit [Methylobacter sp.]
MVTVVEEKKIWPELREDLGIYPGPRSSDGAPTWTLHDPAAHRYYRLGWLEFECLQYWSLADAQQIAETIEQNTPINAEAAEVEEFVRFLGSHQLAKPRGANASRRLAEIKNASHTGFWRWLLHNYLFMRVPLLRPDAYLKKALPSVNGLFQRKAMLLLSAIACLAGYLVAQQWSSFSHSFLYVLTPEGMLATAAMLSLSKLVHELGHAFAASHFGCRVPSMGIALMMGFPVLWTDVTDAWRLPRRQDRLIIDAAGMLAELALAALATLLWTMLPDGALRSGVYVLASTTWLVTLAINLNPFMRFDGYYLFADYLDVANLQDRSFALARWHLRESLFRFGFLPPEVWPRNRHRLLIAYAYATWIYRLLLFTGIAWAVYHFFFKALGLGLFAVEIAWFVLKPIIKEVAVWRELFAIHPTALRPCLALLLPVIMLAFLFIPWQAHLLVPGLLRTEAEFTLYSPQPAQVKHVLIHEGQSVEAGQTLVELTSPDIDFRIASAERHWAELSHQLASQSLDPALARHNPMDLEALQSTLAELQGLRAAYEQLTLRATFNGRVRDLSDALRPGEWLAKDEPLGAVVSRNSVVVAYAEEADLGRLQPGAKGYFYPDGGDVPVLSVQVQSIDRTGARQLTLAELASRYGGALAVREDEQHRLIPEQGVYRIQLQAENTSYPLPITVRGRLALDTPPESLAGRLVRSAVAILIRESSW